MKKFLCVVLVAVAVMAAYIVFRPKTEVYPHIFPDNIPEAISVSYKMPLNFSMFREYKNERITVKVFSGKSIDGTDGKTPLAVYDNVFDKKGNTIEPVRFVWETPANTGDYFIEFYASCLIDGEWVDSPEKFYKDFSVVYPCTEHTFVENEDSVYGTEGIKSDCYTHGTAYKLCSECGVEEQYELDFSHVYNGGITISSASCKDMGYKTFECTKCGETKVEVIEADTDKHRIGAVVKIEPTATRPGSVWFECSRCNYVEPYQTEIPALFMDINPALYYEKPVAWAYDNDYFSLIKGFEFDPNKECDRAVAISLLYLANGVGVLPEDINPFSDVKNGDYFMDAAKWSYKHGVVDSAEFRPYDSCTRAEIVEYLWRMSGSPAVNFEHPFTDVPEDASYSNAVSWAVSKGIASGMTETEFDPYRKCTEAQVITFLYRVKTGEKPEDDGNDFIG